MILQNNSDICKNEEQLKKMLKRLCQLGLFEYKYLDNQVDIIIPYLMNDAVEDYIILKNTTVKGKLLDSWNEAVTIDFIVSFVDEEKDCGTVKTNRQGILLRQGQENVVTIWYEEFEIHCDYYRYDQIGHVWRTGQEPLRRMVYLLGTIFDKYEYIGETACNPIEIEVMQLLGFAPLRFFSPTQENFDDYYEKGILSKLDGETAMFAVAQKVFDRRLMVLLRIYSKTHSKIVKWCIQRHIMSERGILIYEYIMKRINLAAREYANRDYGEQQNKCVNQKRYKVEMELLKKGYQGTYPIFEKDNMQITAIEEHPYVRKEVEYEDITFTIRFMVSVCKHTPHKMQEGFFRGKGNKGWIAQSLKKLFSNDC